MYALSCLVLTSVACAVAFSKPPGPSLPPPAFTKQQLSHDLITPDDLKPLRPFQNDTSYVVKASVGEVDISYLTYTAEPYRDARLSGNDTKVRIASITKLFTVLAVLLSKNKISWDASIRDFVPGLQGDIWDEVTIGALAGHTSGLGYFGHVGDLSIINQFKPIFNPAFLGLPNVKEEEKPKCDFWPGSAHCTYDEMLELFNNPAQVPRSPNSGPLYSNIGFNLLGLALSKAHGKSYEEIIKALIFDPLGMRDSSFDTPNAEEDALLPNPSDEWFSGPFGNYNPTGGIWSTPSDLQLFLRSILNHKLLSPAETRKWLQPRAFTNGINQFVGAPWEIHRWTDFDGMRYKRPIDIFTKSGGVQGYAGYAILVPEFNLSVSITCAGNSSAKAAKQLMLIATKKLIPHCDALARQNAEDAYAGNYTSSSSNHTSVQIAVDDGPGLVLKDMRVKNMPFSATLWKVLGIHPHNQSLRVFPLDPDSLVKDGRQYWRMSISSTRGDDFEEDRWSEGAPAWMDLDRFRYGGQPLDAVEFVMEGGKAVAVQLLGWREVLNRQPR